MNPRAQPDTTLHTTLLIAVSSKSTTVSGGSRGVGRIGRGPLPFRPLFCFGFCVCYFAVHSGDRSGRRTVPLPHNVNDAGAASRHFDYRPSLFTNPGSATDCYWRTLCRMHANLIESCTFYCNVPNLY